MKKTNVPLLSGLFSKIGPKLGIIVNVEKEYGYAGQLIYPNGVVRYFRATTVDINTMGASAIAKDKDYAKLFMANFGYPIIPGSKFYSDSWAKAIGSKRTIVKAWKYSKFKLPVFIKPNSQSQGIAVSKVYNKAEFYKAFKRAAKVDNVILVEEPVAGRDYRVVVLDEKVISAYERIPLTIIGDGKNTVKRLLKNKLSDFLKAGREKTFKIDDFRILASLKRKKLSLKSIISKGVAIVLLPNANLSSGGTSKDVTDSIHPTFRDLAVKLTSDMGLRLCGVDIICNDISAPAADWHVIEINSAPGLDHYVTMGRKQARIVQDLYMKVLVAMGSHWGSH